MNTYETHIGKVDNSTFAIGEKVRAETKISRLDRDDIAETLQMLIGIVSKYTDPAAGEVLDLAQAASDELSADKPEKGVFRRLADATRKMIDKLGPGIIEASALADAVAKISDMIRHL
jgi:hypothetical protein